MQQGVHAIRAHRYTRKHMPHRENLKQWYLLVSHTLVLIRLNINVFGDPTLTRKEEKERSGHESSTTTITTTSTSKFACVYAQQGQLRDGWRG